ncbi:PhzF family phenazine biosynthesis protein [Halomonas sp. HMF6819]|uniref:PhzF family phenazine biosynthesis protein n=1 Tax=Halomonas sp. HMF6819 TaxID=3373085 RepID=UPI0037A9CEE9
MKTATYHLLDVFTDTRFAGNQLAVFLEADALDTRTMQAIAHELNLAETVFLSTATAPGHYPMRIFTPTEELDFAGHPTVGTAQLLAELGLVEREQTLVLAPPVGELSVRFSNKKATFTTARAACVTPGPLSRASAAALLGLEPSQVLSEPVISSCGLAFHLVELADVDALGAVEIAAAEWKAMITPSGAEQVYLYVQGSSDNTGATIRSRMFSMHDSLCEDPATGSAAAALSGYLATLTSTHRWTIHQGVEMGRPSVIETAMDGDLIRVGGRAVRVGKGEIHVE